MLCRYSLVITRNLRISSPPRIEHGTFRPACDTLATIPYRRGQPTRSTRTKGRAASPPGVSQPSSGFEPPPTACETRHIPFIYRDDTNLYLVCVCLCVLLQFFPGLPGWTCMATLTSSGRVAPHCSRPSVQARGVSLYSRPVQYALRPKLGSLPQLCVCVCVCVCV